MKVYWKKRWIKALRSGKYEQGKGALRRPALRGNRAAEFCCLGVLCEVLELPRVYTGYKNPETKRIHYVGLDPELLDKVGLTGKQQALLMHLNDAEGKTFQEIAAYISRNL